MLVIIKSAPNTPEGKRGLSLAHHMSADIVLLQNGVYFMQGTLIADSGFTGKTYVIEDDRLLRGLDKNDEDMGIRYIDYDRLVDLMIQSKKVTGMF